jgi:hypothetical protein
MANFDLSQYETVEERIGRLYQSHPDARIVTELVSPVEQIETTATFIARVYLNGDDTPKATGYAMERAGQGYVNKTSHVENCETSAIGRALANMGLHGSKRPSREEMQKAQGNADIDKAHKLTAQYINESTLSDVRKKSYAQTLEDAYNNGDIGGIRAVYKQVTEAQKQTDEEPPKQEPK